MGERYLLEACVVRGVAIHKSIVCLFVCNSKI